MWRNLNYHIPIAFWSVREEREPLLTTVFNHMTTSNNLADAFLCGGAVASYMVSALISRSGSLGSRPGWGHCVVCVLGQDPTFTEALSTQVYK